VPPTWSSPIYRVGSVPAGDPPAIAINATWSERTAIGLLPPSPSPGITFESTTGLAVSDTDEARGLIGERQNEVADGYAGTDQRGGATHL
jgi:hypothetical protein